MQNDGRGGAKSGTPESFPTLYVGLTQDVVLAEFRRLARRSGRSTTDFLPRELYRIDVELQLVLDLTDPTTVRTLGVDSAALTSDELTTCQSVGDAAHYIGTEAILALSAAGPGSTLAVYTDRLQPASVLTPHLLGQWVVPAPTP